MPDPHEDKITRGARLLKEAEADRDEIIEKIKAFSKKYAPASVVFGCTLIEGQGAKYTYGGPPVPRQTMGNVLAHIAEHEILAQFQGSDSPIQIAHRMPGQHS